VIEKEASLAQADLKRLRAAFRRVPFIRLLGIKASGFDYGFARLYLRATDTLKQNQGILHGGAIASLLDTAAAFAVLTLLNPPERASTVDLTVTFLRPVTKGKVVAEARVTRAGKRLFAVRIEAFDDSGLLLATAMTTYIKLADYSAE
jgi:acyl-CoA thioesterase